MSDVVSRTERNEAFVEMRKNDPGNKKCIDCGRANPQWASVNNSCFFCIDCSGRHRSVGVHISYVRSCTMDSWRKSEIVAMKAGGNSALLAFWKEQGVPKDTSLEDKYSCKAMEAYRDKIKALKEGRPAPSIGKIGFQKPKKAAPPKRVAAEHVSMPNDRSGRGIAGGNNISNISKNSYGGMGSSNYGGMGSGGSTASKGDDPWSALSDGFFNVANYTASATKKAAAVVAESSSKAANVVAQSTKEGAASLGQQDIGTSAAQGWSSFSSWMGKAATTVAASAGTAVQAATEYVAPTGNFTDGLGGDGGNQGGPSASNYGGQGSMRGSSNSGRGSSNMRGSSNSGRGSSNMRGSGQGFGGFDNDGGSAKKDDSWGKSKKDDDDWGKSKKQDDDFGGEWDDDRNVAKKSSMSRSKSETDTSRSAIQKTQLTKSKTDTSDLNVQSLAKALPQAPQEKAKAEPKKDDVLALDDDWWNDDTPTTSVTMKNRKR